MICVEEARMKAKCGGGTPLDPVEMATIYLSRAGND